MTKEDKEVFFAIFTQYYKRHGYAANISVREDETFDIHDDVGNRIYFGQGAEEFFDQLSMPPTPMTPEQFQTELAALTGTNDEKKVNAVAIAMLLLRHLGYYGGVSVYESY